MTTDADREKIGTAEMGITSALPTGIPQPHPHPSSWTHPKCAAGALLESSNSPALTHGLGIGSATSCHSQPSPACTFYSF